MGTLHLRRSGGRTALAGGPTRLIGLSETLIVSYYENNYGGRLNSISDQLRELSSDTTPGFVLNGLKREELIAMNSMILHEAYFDSLGGEGGAPKGPLLDALARDFGSFDRWATQFSAPGQGAGRRLAVGVAHLVASGRRAAQSVGVGPYALHCCADRRGRPGDSAPSRRGRRRP
jgi:hypothetical protein